MMKLVLLVILSLSLNLNAQVFERTEPVKNFDLSKYLGKWYEIGSIEQPFSRDCVCSNANYEAKEKGEIKVVNECRDKTVEGAVRSVEGTGRFVKHTDEGLLEVSFFPFVWGEYRIIELGESYEYSVVTNEEGSTLWVLSRSPQMDQGLLSDIIVRSINKGVDVTNFKLTLQEGCPL